VSINTKGVDKVTQFGTFSIDLQVGCEDPSPSLAEKIQETAQRVMGQQSEIVSVAERTQEMLRGRVEEERRRVEHLIKQYEKLEPEEKQRTEMLEAVKRLLNEPDLLDEELTELFDRIGLGDRVTQFVVEIEEGSITLEEVLPELLEETQAKQMELEEEIEWFKELPEAILRAKKNLTRAQEEYDAFLISNRTKVGNLKIHGGMKFHQPPEPQREQPIADDQQEITQEQGLQEIEWAKGPNALENKMKNVIIDAPLDLESTTKSSKSLQFQDEVRYREVFYSETQNLAFEKTGRLETPFLRFISDDERTLRKRLLRLESELIRANESYSYMKSMRLNKNDRIIVLQEQIANYLGRGNSLTNIEKQLIKQIREEIAYLKHPKFSQPREMGKLRDEISVLQPMIAHLKQRYTFRTGQEWVSDSEWQAMSIQNAGQFSITPKQTELLGLAPMEKAIHWKGSQYDEIQMVGIAEEVESLALFRRSVSSIETQKMRLRNKIINYWLFESALQKKKELFQTLPNTTAEESRVRKDLEREIAVEQDHLQWQGNEIRILLGRVGT